MPKQPPESAADSDTKATEALSLVVSEKRASYDQAAKPERPALQLPSLEVSDERQQAIDEMHEREARRKLEVFRRANIEAMFAAGERYRKCTLDNYLASTPKQQRVVDHLKGYLANLDENLSLCRGVVLYGPVGTGKDHLLFALLREIVARRDDVTVCWQNGQDWFGDVRDAMDGKIPEARLMRGLTKATVAVISDPLPPVGSLGQHMATMLYRVIDDRYSANLPTFVSVNVASNAEADERMGAATWDRLCGGAYKIHCNWASHRKPFLEA